MKVRVHLVNGNIAAIPCVSYHPSFKAHLGIEGDRDIQAGCWVSKSVLKEYNDSYNKTCHELFPADNIDRNLDDLISSIDYAEIPFDILDSDKDDLEPWKNFGNVIKSIDYGGSSLFWNNS